MSLSEMMSAGHEEARPPRRRRRRWLACLPALAILAVLAVVVVVLIGKGRGLLPGPLSEGCQADTPDGIVQLDLDQMENASTIAAVATARNLPERAVTISLATAMQESQLVNLNGGDRDSIGLFQQRPSQGWGTPQQIADPVYATNRFLDKLVQIPGYAQLPLTQAAQDVQHSAYPDAYAQHEADATTLSGALTGRVQAGLSCTVDGVGAASAGTGTSDVSAALSKDFGHVVSTTPLGAAGASSSDSSGASPSGPTQDRLDVQVHGGAYPTEHGWAVAQWAVAHAKDLHITGVTYAGKAWTADASDKGWVAADGSASASAAPASDVSSSSPTDVRLTVASS
ncbi:heavy metal transporter [Streptacidiphilus sp. MAP5-3]|uniref:heavy metal transporter n=1 Tax=unclassified Streptacidiphilus TaxID=2643834 RepID=UPI003514CA7A